ncbi:CpaF family protein [Nocardiopsis coralli]|uniref:CpaF family protein n=1 Tax=Nocardiopsis coralli TaxID=2772213 RepID=UPI001F26A1D2|nr:CpaF family protein [Nocardiopsis coralli]
MGLKDRLEEDRASEGRADRGSVTHWRRRLLAEINLEDLTRLTLAQRRVRLEKVVGHILTREGPVLGERERSVLIRRVVDEALGLGVLEPLLADETVTEIMVNGPDNVFIERDGRMQRVDASFNGEDQLYQTIDRIVSMVNRRVDESSPMVDARLPSGERVNVIIPPLSLSGPVLTIRRFPKPYPIEDLVRMGSLDSATGILLAAMVRSRFNVVVSGGTGSGKTTFLNALSAFVPPDERIVTIEDSAELQLMQDHVVRLESRPPNIEGQGAIQIRDLVRNALRMRPDRIIVGEVRGPETIDMLQAMNTGHDGSLVTVHANSADDAIHRLQTLATMGEGLVPYDALRDQINNAVDAIVHLGRWPDGSRRVEEIAVVSSKRREEFRLDTVLRFEAEPIGPNRNVEGVFRHAPLPRHIAGRIYHVGEAVPAAFGVVAEREAPTQGSGQAAGGDGYVPRGPGQTYPPGSPPLQDPGRPPR